MSVTTAPSTIDEQLERANASGRQPIVFIHGLWLLPSSWDRWGTLFEEAGYTAVSPGWPDDPDTVEEANANPELFAHKSVGQVADSFAAPNLGSEVGCSGAGQSAQSRAGSPTHVRAVPLRLRERCQRRGGPRTLRDVRGSGVRDAAFPGGDGEPQ